MEHSQIAAQFLPFSNEIGTKRFAYYMAQMYKIYFELKSKNTYTRTCTQNERARETVQSVFSYKTVSARIYRRSQNCTRFYIVEIKTRNCNIGHNYDCDNDYDDDSVHTMPFLFNALNSWSFFVFLLFAFL